MRECTSRHPRWSVHCRRATELCTQEPALLAWTWGSKHRRTVAWFGSEHLGLLQILLFKSRLRELRYLPPTNIHPRLRDLKYLPAPSKKGLQGEFQSPESTGGVFDASCPSPLWNQSPFVGTSHPTTPTVQKQQWEIYPYQNTEIWGGKF